MTNRGGRSLLRQELDCAAMGGVPDPREVDDLGLPADVRRDFDATVKEIHALLADGERGAARQLVAERSADLDERAPGAKPYKPLPTDPAELADYIPRW